MWKGEVEGCTGDGEPLRVGVRVAFRHGDVGCVCAVVGVKLKTVGGGELG